MGRSLLVFKSEQEAEHLPRASFNIEPSYIIEARPSHPLSFSAHPIPPTPLHASNAPHLIGIILPSTLPPQLEGWKRRKFWTFRLVDASGGTLVRLSTESAPEGESWVAAFAQNGNSVRWRAAPPSASQSRSPPAPRPAPLPPASNTHPASNPGKSPLTRRLQSAVTSPSPKGAPRALVGESLASLAPKAWEPPPPERPVSSTMRASTAVHRELRRALPPDTHGHPTHNPSRGSVPALCRALLRCTCAHALMHSWARFCRRRRYSPLSSEQSLHSSQTGLVNLGAPASRENPLRPP